MTDSNQSPETLVEDTTVDLPAPTVAPLVLSLGIALMAAGLVTNLGFVVPGLLLVAVGLGTWIAQLLPDRGHVHVPVVPSEQPLASAPRPGTVEPLHPGAVGYRFRLPEHVHPISSGARGGLVGGLLMPIPALLYGVIEHGSPWLPINLLVGMVIPGVTDASLESLRQFNLTALVLGTFIHVAFSITFGLMYGVILPTLPPVRGGPLLFGGVVMPILWSGVCYGLMGIVNPLLERHVSWPWFIASQFVYGLAMSYVVYKSEKVPVRQGSGGRSQESGVRGQESGVRGQESGVRGQGSGVRSQESGIRGQG